MRKFIPSSLLAPIILLIIYIAILTIVKGSLPPADQIIANLESLYSKYGYEIIFIGAFLEGALIIDLFVPGSSIVLFGAVFASTGAIQFPLYLLSAFCGFTLGFFVDYLLGYYGWSGVLVSLGLGKELEKAKTKMRQMGGRAFFLGYFHPDVASLFATAAGIIKLDLKEFFLYNFLAGSVWLLLWSSLAYFVGEAFIETLRKSFLVSVVVVVLVWLIVKWYLGRKK
jgi:membrane-associated protein